MWFQKHKWFEILRFSEHACIFDLITFIQYVLLVSTCELPECSFISWLFVISMLCISIPFIFVYSLHINNQVGFVICMLCISISFFVYSFTYKWWSWPCISLCCSAFFVKLFHYFVCITEQPETKAMTFEKRWYHKNSGQYRERKKILQVFLTKCVRSNRYTEWK